MLAFSTSIYLFSSFFFFFLYLKWFFRAKPRNCPKIETGFPFDNYNPFYRFFYLRKIMSYVYPDYRIPEYWKILYGKYGDKGCWAELPDGYFLVQIFDAESIEYVLKGNFNNYIKGEDLHYILYPFLQNGIFSVDGILWKQQRQVASHLFSAKELKGFMMDTFIEHSEIVVKKLERHLEEAKNMGKDLTMDIQDLFQRFSLESICKIAFGIELGGIEGDVNFARDWDIANEAVCIRLFTPVWKYYKTQHERNLEQSVKRINEYCFNVISQRRKEFEQKGAPARYDLLSRYIQLTDPETNQPFSDDYLRDIITNLILAGRDTVSQLLIWTLYLLDQNPDVEQKLLQEIESMLHNGPVTFDGLKEMQYLHGMLYETLRLWPPVPFERKTSVNDDILPNGIFVPKDTIVAFSLHTLGRLNKFWDEPEKVKPERWFNKTSNPGFYPFLIGPRQCLGKVMAEIEASCVLVYLLPKFKFKYVGSHPPPLDRTVTLRVNGQMNMIVSKR